MTKIDAILKSYLKVISEAADEITDTYYDEVNKMTEDLKEKRPGLALCIDEMLMELALRGFAGYEKQFIQLLIDGPVEITDANVEDLPQFFENFDKFKDVVSFTDFPSFGAMKACFGVGHGCSINNCKQTIALLVDNGILDDLKYEASIYRQFGKLEDMPDSYYEKLCWRFLKNVDQFKTMPPPGLLELVENDSCPERIVLMIIDSVCNSSHLDATNIISTATNRTMSRRLAIELMNKPMTSFAITNFLIKISYNINTYNDEAFLKMVIKKLKSSNHVREFEIEEICDNLLCSSNISDELADEVEHTYPITYEPYSEYSTISNVGARCFNKNVMKRCVQGALNSTEYEDLISDIAENENFSKEELHQMLNEAQNETGHRNRLKDMHDIIDTLKNEDDK